MTQDKYSPTRSVTLGFVLAGLFNIVGMLVVTRGFTSDALTRLDPGAFSPTGCAVVCLWGLAYMGLATSYHRAPSLALVFCVEKMFYAIRWVWWLSINVEAVVAHDTWSPFFYTYGFLDGLWGLFFFGVWWRYRGV